jgi:serine/threonine protein kinase
MSAESKQRAVQEMPTLLNLAHPNIVRYHRAFLYEGRLCYMTEFAECGTLHHLVYTVKERGQRLPDALVWHLFTQICHGLKKLHDSGVLHRALKTRNLLLFPENLYTHPYLKYRCKLTDLGIPELQRRVRLGELDGSTLRYVAPEVLATQQPGDERADVWSLGCVLYEMVTLSHAFNATSAIQRGEFTPLPSHVSSEMREVLESIFQLEPSSRPSVDELLQVPAVASCAAEMPNPVLLEGAQPPSPTVDVAARQAGGAVPGTAVWAKQASDGMWHRGVVHSSVDADCCFVHFVERRSVELVWHDGLRVVPPSPGTGSTLPSRASSSSSSVIPGFGREDAFAARAVDAASAKREDERSGAEPSGADRNKRPSQPSMMRWSEELSDNGEEGHERDHGSERGGGSRRMSMDRNSLGVSESGACSGFASVRHSPSLLPSQLGLQDEPPAAYAYASDGEQISAVSPNGSEKQRDASAVNASPKQSASRACVLL